ncbi:MAG TPA: helicase, partial [Thermoanaerobaculia bacterium]
MDVTGITDAGRRFLNWLCNEVLASARGDNDIQLEVQPSGRFWLGRLASEEAIEDLGLGDRGERLSPCAIGIRLLPTGPPPWSFTVTASACCWIKRGDTFHKSARVAIPISVTAEARAYEEQRFGVATITSALTAAAGVTGHRAEIRVETSHDLGGQHEVTVTLVNTTPKDAPDLSDRNLYECGLEISDLPHRQYSLEALP